MEKFPVLMGLIYHKQCCNFSNLSLPLSPPLELTLANFSTTLLYLEGGEAILAHRISMFNKKFINHSITTLMLSNFNAALIRHTHTKCGVAYLNQRLQIVLNLERVLWIHGLPAKYLI